MSCLSCPHQWPDARCSLLPTAGTAEPSAHLVRSRVEGSAGSFTVPLALYHLCLGSATASSFLSGPPPVRVVSPLKLRGAARNVETGRGVGVGHTAQRRGALRLEPFPGQGVDRGAIRTKEMAPRASAAEACAAFGPRRPLRASSMAPGGHSLFEVPGLLSVAVSTWVVST